MGWRDIFRSKAPPLSDMYRDQPTDVVVTHDINEHWQSVLDGKRWNPDDLVGKLGLPIYSKMLVDEQVKSVTEFKLNAILGRGYQFKFPGKTKLSKTQQAERVDVFETVLRRMRGSFVDAMEGIASGREYGFSITEKVYGDIKVEAKTYTGINMLLTREPGSFEFYADDYGLLKKIEQRTVKSNLIPVDRDKVIHYVHKPKWDLIYGRSELRSAYRSWYAKDQLIKLWLLHLEKFGSGVWKAMQDTEARLTPNSPEYVALKAALANVRALSSIILPPGVTAEIEFPATTDQYERGLQYFDLGIAKSQLVPNLLGLSHTGQTGAYSQSQTQFEAFFWTTSADGSRLSECLNEELFRDLGDQNWGDDDYPAFCFKPLSLEHLKWVFTAWKDMLGMKAVIPTEEDERFLRQLLEMPERDPDAEPLVDPMEDRQQTHTEDQAAVANERADKEMSLREKEATKKAMMSMQTQIDDLKAKLTSVNVTVHNPAPSAPATSVDPHVSEAGLEGGRVVPHGELRSCTLEQFTRATLRVNFSVIEKRTDDFAQAAIPNLATIVAKAARRALGDDANMATLIDEDPSDVAAVDLNGADRGKLKSACRDLLVQSWTLGSDLASNEIQRARGERMSFSARKAMFANLRDNAAAWFETQAFRMAGDTSDQVKKIIQQELQNGIKFGKTIPEVRVAIWERLVEKGLTTLPAVLGTETSDAVVSALNDLGLPAVDDVATYLNTLVRTNTFEALNEARYAEFTDPAVADFVEALEYAAVLDSSTTTICRELNGKVYRADSDQWNTIRPPNHFNALPMGTKVYTKHGYRPIEELKVGTLVLTHAGRYRRITETMMHETWPTEVVLHLAGGKQFVCTEDHPILTLRGWVCAGDLTESDEVIAIEGPCLECGTVTPHPKYCSKRCSGIVAGRRFKAQAVDRPCQHCGEPIKIKGKKKNQLYCGQDCMSAAMRKVPTRNCRGCGEPMVSKWKKPVSQQRLFCSQPCYFKHKGETSIERTVREWLAIDHIRAEPQKRFGRYTVDFYLPDFHAAIEVDGDYWHTVMDKPAHVKKRRDDYLTAQGLSLIRLPQSAVQSGRFKRIVSEWLHAAKQVSTAGEDRANRAPAMQQAGL